MVPHDIALLEISQLEVNSLSMLMPLRLRGFTLIEIMVVVVIMGVLAALLVPRLMGRADDARILAAKQDIATLMQALKL